MLLTDLPIPIVQAPMAGGPSTLELARAVSDVGGLGFLAAGYRSSDAVQADIQEMRRQTKRPFGVNLFVGGPATLDQPALRAYLTTIEPEAARYGVALGEPRHSDDNWKAKLEVVLAERPPVVSFTFGCPEPALISELHAKNIEVWVTITDPIEAERAVTADALIVQGAEAGGHQGSFEDRDQEPLSLMTLLQLLAHRSDRPLIAAGGIATGAAVASALAAGATAVQIGTALMLSTEAATHPAHRLALASETRTALTRAFTGRQARGILNRFQIEHSLEAPSAYPHIHYATSPIRAAARDAGERDDFNLWAGQAHELAETKPASDILNELWHDARVAALRAAELTLRHGRTPRPAGRRSS